VTPLSGLPAPLARRLAAALLAAIEGAGRKVVRARDGKLTALDADPKWLSGYKGNASTEALGSLLANVDGRNVPLTMGYHKVIVDIRDQIARSVPATIGRWFKKPGDPVAVDEPVDSLGGELKLPPGLAARREAIAAALPPLG